MRRKYLVALIFLVLLPGSVEAACTDTGYTVVFVNGIFNTKEEAGSSRKALEVYLGKTFREEKIIVRLGYNPSHLAGLGDLIQTATQAFGASVSSFDRDTILLQIHPEVTTRKLFLVGHSQGTYYTNDIYTYLATHGEPKEAVGVYNVATPANYVAGGGTYLTSEYDSIINAYANTAKDVGGLPPLAPNVKVAFSSLGNGHSFTDNYLEFSGERMVADIERGLARLQSAGTEEGDCFVPPPRGAAYVTKAVFYAVADPAAVGIKAGTVGVAKAAVAVKNVTMAAVSTAGGAVGGFFNRLNPFAKIEPRTKNLEGSFSVVKSLYGSSLQEKELQELLGDQGAAAVEAVRPEPPKVEVKKKEEAGVVAGVEIEQPAQPLVPFPTAPSLSSPGFGGGGGGGSAPPPPAAAPVQEVVVTYTFTAQDAHGASTECAFDTDPPVPCDGSFSKSLGAGAHTFRVTATDGVGNQATETRNFTVQ